MNSVDTAGDHSLDSFLLVGKSKGTQFTEEDNKDTQQSNVN